MDTLPDLDCLSVVDKDELIRALFAEVQGLRAEIVALKGRLVQDSRNSSKPPAADGYRKPKPKSLRPRGQNPTGGAPGHKGHTLEKTQHPNHIIRHAPPTTCEACGLSREQGQVVETRQVFDRPPLPYEVTEHQVLAVRCTCGKVQRGEFPEGVSAPVQYGPRLKAAVVHLTQHHMVPVQRAADLMSDLFELPLSDATVLAAVDEAYERLEPTVAEIGQAMVSADIAHADETGLGVAGINCTGCRGWPRAG